MSVVAAILVLPGLLGCSRAGRKSPEEPPVSILSVAAAADLRFVLDDIALEFQGKHPDIQVRVTYGSSGNFFAQLTNNAPFDLFLSADTDYPRRLIEQGLAARASAFVYAVGHLVVWVPRDSSLDIEKLGVQALLDPSAWTIAFGSASSTGTTWHKLPSSSRQAQRTLASSRYPWLLHPRCAPADATGRSPWIPIRDSSKAG